MKCSTAPRAHQARSERMARTRAHQRVVGERLDFSLGITLPSFFAAFHSQNTETEDKMQDVTSAAALGEIRECNSSTPSSHHLLMCCQTTRTFTNVTLALPIASAQRSAASSGKEAAQ